MNATLHKQEENKKNNGFIHRNNTVLRNNTALDKGFLEVPSRIFKDRNVAVLEAVVEYMKDIEGLSYHEIAVLLNRNERTIWTVYSRAKQKRKRV
jgi:DNA-binding NarL/FixJ family response regulator